MPKCLRLSQVDQQNNKEFQFQSDLGKNIRDTFGIFGKDLYTVCKTLSPTNSDELNLARKYFQTFRTCVLTFSPLKRMEKQTRRNQVAFLWPVFPLWKQHFHVANSAPTNSGELRSWVISEIWFPLFSLISSNLPHSAWVPKFLPSCYKQGRGQGHTLSCVLKIPDSQRTTLLAKKNQFQHLKTCLSNEIYLKPPYKSLSRNKVRAKKYK